MNISDRQKYIGNTAIGLTGGAAAYVWVPQMLTKNYLNLCQKKGKRFTYQENQEIWNGAQQAFQDSFLKDRKVELIDYNETNWEPIADKVVKLRRDFIKKTKNPFIKILSKTWPSDKEFKERLYMYAEGKNACYMPATSQILVNKEKRGSAVFHEMGHATNAKGLGLGKILAKTRGKATKLVPFAFCISMLTPKDREDSPTKNKIYKYLLDFKKNSGLIVSACMLPMVIEEGIASLRGAEYAKKVLSPELYKKVNKSNLMAFSSYVVVTVLAGLGTTLANYIKDKVTGPLPAKTQTTDNA